MSIRLLLVSLLILAPPADACKTAEISIVPEDQVSTMEQVQESLERTVEEKEKILVAAGNLQSCILTLAYEVMRKDPKLSSTDREQLEKVAPMLKDTQSHMEELLRTSVRILDRSLVRNFGSYAFQNWVPERIQFAAQTKLGVQSAFQKIDVLRMQLKRDTLDLLREFDITLPDDELKYTDIQGAKKAKKYDPKQLQSKKFVSRGDLLDLLTHPYLDPKIGKPTFNLNYQLLASPLASLGYELAENLEPILGDAPILSQKTLNGVESAKKTLSKAFSESLPRQLKEWKSKAKTMLENNVSDPKEKNRIRDSCTKEWDSIQKLTE